MIKKIFRSILLTSVLVLIIGLTIAVGCSYYYFDNIQKQRLVNELSLSAHGVEKYGVDYLKKIKIDDLRITLVGQDGRVLFDTNADASTMENHANRKEIKEAFKLGNGESSRYSSTLTQKTIYHATLLNNNTVLRVSVSQTSVFALVLGIVPWFILALILSAIFAWLLAKQLSERIITPLNQVDLEHPLENDTYEELTPLLSKIHHQHKQIDFQLMQLRQKTREFELITANMKEGLVLLDNKGKILSINPSASALFGAESNAVGADFLAIERSHKMNLATNLAKKEGHTTIRDERNGRSYQFDITRIENAEKNMGLVILAFDVSEQEYAERTRREFSANVSHELKTPLTSIIASADLIENNLVKAEDLARFIGHIKKEASRLLALLEDIIRLSQLDEGMEMPTETIDISVVANEVVQQLQDTADHNNVELTINTESCILQGVPQLLHEIIYNLVENAIKYNISGGKVNVAVSKTNNAYQLKVSDTGIGIPLAHQKRVFERFYRVDKSHSRQSGGSGLGLSIVKHAAFYFNADIALESELGKGTTITVTFPI